MRPLGVLIAAVGVAVVAAMFGVVSGYGGDPHDVLVFSVLGVACVFVIAALVAMIMSGFRRSGR